MDQDPGFPDASLARTRQYQFDDESVDVANCEGVTVWSTASDEKSLALLIWISYETAPLTSDQSNDTVWPGENLLSLAGERRVGAGSGPVGAGSGFTVRVAVLVTPAPETEIVTRVCVVTGMVVVENPPVVDPDGMVTLFGTLATAGLLLVSDIERSEVAGEAIVTVPNEPVVPDVVDGLSVSDVGGCWGVSVSCVCTVVPFHVALMVTVVVVVTALVGTLTVTE